MIARATMRRWAMPPDRASTGASAKRLSLMRSISAVEAALAALADMPKNRPWK
jgi:hypothetical protein